MFYFFQVCIGTSKITMGIPMLAHYAAILMVSDKCAINCQHSRVPDIIFQINKRLCERDWMAF